MRATVEDSQFESPALCTQRHIDILHGENSQPPALPQQWLASMYISLRLRAPRHGTRMEHRTLQLPTLVLLLLGRMNAL